MEDGTACAPDSNECTAEYCSLGECLSKPVADGTACTFKGLFPGVCVSGLCGKDLCEDVVCDDGDACTVGTCSYVDGTCDFAPIVCDDRNPCTEDTCDSAVGCVFTEIEDCSSWTCPQAYYGTADGCDCGCGALDPDCVDGTVASCEFCDVQGSCSYLPCPGDIDPAKNWLCNGSGGTGGGGGFGGI